jgi:hypothetical protein
MRLIKIVEEGELRAQHLGHILKLDWLRHLGTSGKWQNWNRLRDRRLKVAVKVHQQSAQFCEKEALRFNKMIKPID